MINNGSAITTTNKVTLNNASLGGPTSYIASEDKSFAGASWQTYSTAPAYLLSAGFGTKMIYFKVKNADGESNVKSATIEFRLNPQDAFKDDDGDGLSNMLEYRYGSDPTKKDTDGDGLSDYAEVKGKSNPTATDSDGDGLPDAKDPYPSSPYHNSLSENYMGRVVLNEGGASRNSSTYKTMDSLGNGLSGRTLSVQSHPALSFTPDLLDFKAVKLGDYAAVSIMMTSSGIGDLTISNITFTGQDSNEFYKSVDTCSGQGMQAKTV